MLGSRSDRDGQDRGPDLPAQGQLYDRDRDAQYAAGGARRRLYGILSAGKAGGIRQYHRDLQDSRAERDGRLRHRPIRLISEDVENEPLRHFIEELEQLKTKLLEMSALVESAIQRSILAVTQKDRSAAEQVFRNEARINAIELEIDEFAINLLALHQPMAADLRLIVAALKINTDLERMGDLSVNIAQRARSLMEEPVVKPMIDIPHIAGLVQSMVRKSLDAFVTRDADLARSVLASDDAVDSLRTASYHELVSFMEKDT